MDFKAFAADRLVLYAVVRALEIISEASRHIPAEVKSRHPAIEWRNIAAVGNLYRHQYDGVDDAFVWDVVVRDLEPLVVTMKKELLILKG